MKRRVSAVIAATAIAVAVLAATVGVYGGNGNGAPSGPHYNLNLIGLAKGGSASAESNGHVVFVPLWGNCKIELQMGDYKVVDPNCLEGNARFQLPNPAPEGATVLAYSVWIRAVTPKGSALMQACFTDTTVGETFCNSGTLVVSLQKVTPPKFTDVSKQLLQVCVNGNLQPLFQNAYYDYFWSYTNSGLHLAQMRFYPVSTAPVGGPC